MKKYFYPALLAAMAASLAFLAACGDAETVPWDINKYNEETGGQKEALDDFINGWIAKCTANPDAPECGSTPEPNPNPNPTPNPDPTPNPTPTPTPSSNSGNDTSSSSTTTPVEPPPPPGSDIDLSKCDNNGDKSACGNYAAGTYNITAAKTCSVGCASTVKSCSLSGAGEGSASEEYNGPHIANGSDNGSIPFSIGSLIVVGGIDIKACW
ncbi:MAG: hypothetical protein LBH25_06445 [Fibromonadaceae bacterium]|jgi:hypothetical protein|nr:hypothetical protein [Fibromonadaceae bacterium]